MTVSFVEKIRWWLPNTTKINWLYLKVLSESDDMEAFTQRTLQNFRRTFHIWVESPYVFFSSVRKLILEQRRGPRYLVIYIASVPVSPMSIAAEEVIEKISIA